MCTVNVKYLSFLIIEHMQVIKEEISTLSEQCTMAEKEKKDAETRLEVLSSFFQEKEAQRQKYYKFILMLMKYA